MSVRNAIRDMNLSNFVTWANIRADDQKMMFCASQAAGVIRVEHMAELALAASIIATLPQDRDPAEYARLKKMFHAMVVTSIRDTSKFADDQATDQVC